VAIGRWDTKMREVVFCLIEPVNTGIIANPDCVIGVLQDTCDKIAGEGIFITI
jgi:hypothetical protein